MADTNQVQLSYIEEVTPGTTPADALTELRITDESFGHNITNTQSNEIRSDRQVTDLVAVDAESAGGYNFEFSYGTPPDAILEAALMTTFGTGVDYEAAQNKIAFVAATNTMTDVDNKFVTEGIKIGQWLQIGGSTSNDGLHKVLTVVAGTVTFTTDTIIVGEVIGAVDIIIKGTVSIDASSSAWQKIAAGNDNGVYTCSAGNPIDEGIRVGQWIEIRSFTESENNGYKLVIAVNATTFTTLQTTVTEAEGDNVTVTGNMIRNDTVSHSYTIQRELIDAVQFFKFRGQEVSSLALSVAAGSIITGTVDFMGLDIATTDLAQTTFGTGADVAAPTTSVMSGVSNVGQVMESSTLADIAADLYVQSIDFTVNNNLRGNKAIGTLGSVKVGAGECDVDGSFNVLFNDETLYDKYLAGTETALSFKCEDTAGNAYIITFHRIKIETDDGGKATGSDADVVENITFKAIRHATYDCTIQIDKFPA